MEPILYTQYKEKIVPELQKELGLKNVMQVPRIKKVTVNVGYGKKMKDKSFIDTVDKTLQDITGQKPVHNKAKKSISNFKLREGVPIAASVTLRGNLMYEFLYKFIHLTLPRVRDFRGLSKKSFDKQGNYSVGMNENIAFPEITADTADKIHGLQVVISTTAKSKESGTMLLEQFGFPFKKS